MQDLRIGVIGLADGWSSNKLADAVGAKTGYRCLIEMDRISFDVSAGEVYHGDLSVSSMSALIVKKIGKRYSPDLIDRLEILKFLKSLGVRVFSDPESMIRSIDRLSCTTTLRLGGIPVPPTVITENLTEAEKAVRRFGGAVLKPLYTSKARGMVVLKPGDDISARVRDFQAEGNPLMYIQKLIDLPGRDLGLAFLGGEYIATYARVRNGNAWNTSTRSGGSYEAVEPSDDIVQLAKRAQGLFGLDFTCVDVVETDDGPLVFEVSAFGGFRGLLHANNIDAADLYADYVVRKVRE